MKHEVTNTLAYYDMELIMCKKSLIVQAPGANYINIFSSLLTGWQNKLDCLTLPSVYVLA